MGHAVGYMGVPRHAVSLASLRSRRQVSLPVVRIEKQTRLVWRPRGVGENGATAKCSNDTGPTGPPPTHIRLKERDEDHYRDRREPRSLRMRPLPAILPVVRIQGNMRHAPRVP
jgi:hypothetical protein